MTTSLTDADVLAQLTEEERACWDDHKGKTTLPYPLLRTIATERIARKEAEAKSQRCAECSIPLGSCSSCDQADAERERAEAALAEAVAAKKDDADELARVMMPFGVEFLDPPDGGSVSLNEQAARIVDALIETRADVERLIGEQIIERNYATDLRLERDALAARLAEVEAGVAGMRLALEDIKENVSPQRFMITGVIDAALATNAGAAFLAEHEALKTRCKSYEVAMGESLRVARAFMSDQQWKELGGDIAIAALAKVRT